MEDISTHIDDNSNSEFMKQKITMGDLESISPTEKPQEFYKTFEQLILNVEGIEKEAALKGVEKILGGLSPDESVRYIMALLKIGIYYSRGEVKHFKVLEHSETTIGEAQSVQSLYGNSLPQTDFDTKVPLYRIGSICIEDDNYTPTIQGQRIRGINAIFIRKDQERVVANELSHIAFQKLFEGSERSYPDLADRLTSFFTANNLPARDLIEVNEFLSDVSSINSYTIPIHGELDSKLHKEVEYEMIRILQIGIAHNSGSAYHLPNYSCSGKIMIQAAKEVFQNRGIPEIDVGKLLGLEESTQQEKIAIAKKYSLNTSLSRDEMIFIQGYFRKQGKLALTLIKEYIA